MNHKTTVRKIESTPVRDECGHVTKHRLSIPFLGTFTIYPSRYRESGLDSILAEVIGQQHTVASLNKFLATQ